MEVVLAALTILLAVMVLFVDLLGSLVLLLVDLLPLLLV
jgi:hypothetical protein